MAELPSTSAELSLNELTIAAMLGTVCAQNHQEETKFSEYFQRNGLLGKYDHIDQINIQQVQMKAKAFVDQMLINRKLLREGRNSESNSFSNALEVLSLKKGLLLELLKDPGSTRARRIKDLNPSQTGKDTVKSIIGGKISECEGGDAAGASAKYGRTVFTAQPSEKIVIRRPVPPSAHHSGIVSCYCSSLQFLYRSNRRVSDDKTSSFSFSKIKKKLKFAFGVAKKEPSQLLCSLDKPSQERSNPGIGSECSCNGVGIKNSFSSSTEYGKKGKLSKNEELKSASVNDSTRRILDFSSARYSNKQDFDVILEAKRHLSTRLNHLISVEGVTSKKAPRTLERVLSSPEPDFWPFSLRRDSPHFSGSAEIRLSPYNTSPRVIECSSHVGNELRPKAEVSSREDANKLLRTADAEAYSLFPRTEAEARDNNISDGDDMKIHVASEIAERNNFVPHESRSSGEVLSKKSSVSITRPSEMRRNTIKAQENDGIVINSVLDSVPQNEAVTSTLDRAEGEHPVLEPFLANTPSTIITHQAARMQMQPRRLNLEECSAEPFPHYPWEEYYHLCQYVKLLLEASCLNWDRLAEIIRPPDKLLRESLFHEVELPPHDDPKLLFDHINEVLLKIYKIHFCYPWLASSTTSTSLVKVVVDEILAEEAESRTLEQPASRDVASWLDVRLDVEHVVVEISEAVVEECLLDTLLQFHT